MMSEIIVQTHNITPVLQRDKKYSAKDHKKMSKQNTIEQQSIPSVVSQATPPTKIFLSKKKKVGYLQALPQFPIGF